MSTPEKQVFDRRREWESSKLLAAKTAVKRINYNTSVQSNRSELKVEVLNIKKVQRGERAEWCFKATPLLPSRFIWFPNKFHVRQISCVLQPWIIVNLWDSSLYLDRNKKFFDWNFFVPENANNQTLTNLKPGICICFPLSNESNYKFFDRKLTLIFNKSSSLIAIHPLHYVRLPVIRWISEQHIQSVKTSFGWFQLTFSHEHLAEWIAFRSMFAQLSASTLEWNFNWFLDANDSCHNSNLLICLSTTKY